MSKKSNPTVIGGFVIGAVALLVVAVALFGGADMLAPRATIVAYFLEDTKGLRVGSNVVMNGVRVGQVSGMSLIVDRANFASMVEVTLDIQPDAFVTVAENETLDLHPELAFSEYVNVGGLRAALEAESFVTGQLMVEFEFRPDTPAILRGGDDPPYPEVPTIPSNVQELMEKIRTWTAKIADDIDLQELGARVESILVGVDELVNSDDLRETFSGVNSIINDDDTQALATTLRAALDDIGIAARDAAALARNADGKIDAVELGAVVDRIAATLEEAEAALHSANYVLRGESSEMYQLGVTLKEVESAARALREFLDFLEQNPEALLRGKK